MTADNLGKDVAENLAGKLGFKKVENVEKMIMDARVHKALVEKIKCCLRGGMCTPFYVTSPKSMRLSVDLDLFVEYAYDDAKSKIIEIMADIGFKAVARKPRRIKNLLQIDIRYGTDRLKHDQKEHIKIDVMCGVNFEPFMKNIPSGHDVFIGKTEYDITAVTHGCLIADKIASLAINGTGYKEKDKVPKQMHDIGYLLDEITVDELTKSLSMFKEVTELKTAGDEQVSAVSEIQHVVRFLGSLVVVDGGISLCQEYLSNFNRFRQEYLSENFGYSLSDIKYNVLKTFLYSIGSKKTVMGEADAESCAKVIHDAINGTPVDLSDIRQELKGKMLHIGDKTVALSDEHVDAEAAHILRILYGIWRMENEQKPAR